MNVCFEVATTVSPVVSNSSPEGNIPEDAILGKSAIGSANEMVMIVIYKTIVHSPYFYIYFAVRVQPVTITRVFQDQG